MQLKGCFYKRSLGEQTSCLIWHQNRFSHSKFAGQQWHLTRGKQVIYKLPCKTQCVWCSELSRGHVAHSFPDHRETQSSRNEWQSKFISWKLMGLIECLSVIRYQKLRTSEASEHPSAKNRQRRVLSFYFGSCLVLSTFSVRRLATLDCSALSHDSQGCCWSRSRRLRAASAPSEEVDSPPPRFGNSWTPRLHPENINRGSCWPSYQLSAFWTEESPESDSSTLNLKNPAASGGQK